MVDNLISIIMPSYNTGKYIGSAINSVLKQSYSNWELIIVDDCSTDNTDDVVKFFKDERIKYIKNKKNIGAALTRNKAIRQSQGEWISFLDSDDLWDEKKLEKMIFFAKTNNYAFVYHNYEKIDETGKQLNVYVTGPKIVTKRKMYHYDYIGCLTFMYSAKVCGVIQIEDIKKNNDYAILLKLIKKSNCYLLDENLAKYRVRTKSISHDKLTKKIRSHYELFRLCDYKSPIFAFCLACLNMWFGFWKKIKYEKQSKKRN